MFTSHFTVLHIHSLFPVLLPQSLVGRALQMTTWSSTICRTCVRPSRWWRRTRSRPWPPATCTPYRSRPCPRMEVGLTNIHSHDCIHSAALLWDPCWFCTHPVTELSVLICPSPVLFAEVFRHFDSYKCPVLQSTLLFAFQRPVETDTGGRFDLVCANKQAWHKIHWKKRVSYLLYFCLVFSTNILKF